MAVVGQRKNRTFKQTAQMDERRLNSLQKQLDKAKATKDKMNRIGNKEISNATRDARIKMLQAEIRKIRGVKKLDPKTVKTTKVSTPNRRLAKNESNIKRGTTMGGRPYGSLTTKKKVAKKKVTKNTVTKKKVTKKRTVSKRSVNRAGQRYGQR